MKRIIYIIFLSLISLPSHSDEIKLGDLCSGAMSTLNFNSEKFVKSSETDIQYLKELEVFGSKFKSVGFCEGFVTAWLLQYCSTNNDKNCSTIKSSVSSILSIFLEQKSNNEMINKFNDNPINTLNSYYHRIYSK